MAINYIESGDTLQTGFRVKANSNFGEIIQSITLDKNGTTPLYNGKYRFVKANGSFFLFDPTDQYYTKVQVAQLIANVGGSPYAGMWSSALTYGVGAVVDLNGTLWRSNSANNTNTPGDTSGKWIDILSTAMYQIITFGTAVPDNATGSNGDIYFRSNEQVYQKLAGSWTVAGTLPTGSGGGVAYSFTLDTAKPDVYTLNSTQLTAVNAIGKIPNFVALVGGRQYYDIWPTYNGAVGAYTSITINLHTDGAGHNAETTVVQFS